MTQNVNIGDRSRKTDADEGQYMENCQSIPTCCSNIGGCHMPMLYLFLYSRIVMLLYFDILAFTYKVSPF